MDPDKIQGKIGQIRSALASEGASNLTDAERSRLEGYAKKLEAALPSSGMMPDPSKMDMPPPIVDQPGGILPELGRKLISPAMSMAEHYVDKATFGLGTNLAEAIDPTYAARAESRTEQNPAAAGTGDVAGYMLGPGPKLLAHGAGAAVRSIPGVGGLGTAAERLAGAKGRGLLGTVAREGAVGAVEGAAVPLVEHTVDPGQEGDLANEMLSGALWGGGIGAGLGAVGAMAAGRYHALRDPAKNPDIAKPLRQLEAGGGGTTTPSRTGVRPPEGYEELAQKSVEDTGLGGPISGMPADEALEPAAQATQQQLARRHAQTEARHVEEATPYYESTEGRVGVALHETLDELTRAYARRKGLPFDADSATERLLGHIDKLTELRIVPKGAPAPAGRSYRVELEDYKRLFPPEEVERALTAASSVPGSALARRGSSATSPAPQLGTGQARGDQPQLGTGQARGDQLARGPEEVFAEARDIPGASSAPGPEEVFAEARDIPGASRAPASGSGGRPGGAPRMPDSGAVDVYLVPKKMSAQDFDTMERSLQFMKQGKLEPDAAKFQRTLLRDRDQFPSNAAAPAPAEPIRFPDGSESQSGWTAMKDRHTRELSEFEAMGFSTGLRAGETPNTRAAEQMLRIQQAIHGMAEGGGRAGRDKFIARLVKDNPEAREAIRKFLASKAFERLQHPGATPRGLIGSSKTPQIYLGGGLNPLRFNLDPMMRQVALRSTGERGGHAAQVMDDFARWMDPGSSGYPLTKEDLMSLFQQATAEEGGSQ